MSPRHTFDPEQRYQPTIPDVTELVDRLDAVERQQRQLKRAIDAVARQSGVSIGCPCTRCEQSYLLVADGRLSCPACGYSESL